ncbi:hypothetical protein NSTCB13_01153 [Nostoc sp. DSM 114160]
MLYILKLANISGLVSTKFDKCNSETWLSSSLLNRIYGNPSSPAEEYDGDERINMVKAIVYGQLFLAESARKLHKYRFYSETCMRIAIAWETRSKLYLFVKTGVMLAVIVTYRLSSSAKECDGSEGFYVLKAIASLRLLGKVVYYIALALLPLFQY